MLKKYLTVLFVICVSVTSTEMLFATERVDSLSDVAVGTVRDAAYIVTSPLRLNTNGLLITLGSVAAVAAVGTLDTTIRTDIQYMREHKTKTAFKYLDQKNNIFDKLGKSNGVIPICGAFYAGGWVFDSERAKRVGYLGAESWIFNNYITILFKDVIGRKRPGGRADIFKAFSGNSSMPSGHTSTAFCLASVISTEYNSTPVSIASYGVASMVAFWRLYIDVHWASDVVAAAILGTVIGKATCSVYDTDPQNWHIIFGGNNVGVAKRF